MPDDVLDGVILVLQREDRFLVGQRAPHKRAGGYWTQVSGTVEPDETQPETVVREALEELGCTVRPVEKLQSMASHNTRYRLHYWRVELLDGEPRICNDELTALRWVTIDEMRGLSPVFEEDIALFEQLLKTASAGDGRYKEMRSEQ